MKTETFITSMQLFVEKGTIRENSLRNICFWDYCPLFFQYMEGNSVILTKKLTVTDSLLRFYFQPLMTQLSNFCHLNAVKCFNLN